MPFNYFLVICIISIVIAIDRGKLGRGISIIKVFNIAWLFCFIIYLSGYYNYYPIRGDVCLYSAMFVISTNVTFLFFKKGKSVSSINKEEFDHEIVASRKLTKVIIALSVICWVLSFNRIQTSLAIMMLEGATDLRGQVMGGTVYSTIEMLSYQYFVQPLFSISIILAAQSLILEKKKNFILIVTAVINAAVYSILFGGRSPFAQIIIYTFILLIISNGGNIVAIIKKQKKIIFWGLLFFIPVYLYASLRVNREWGLFSEVGLYLTAGCPFLSQVLSDPSTRLGTSNGILMIGGIYDTFGLAARFLNFHPELAQNIYSDLVTDNRFISPDIQLNFTATAILSFLIDFGKIGPIIGGFVYGTVFSFIENKFFKKQNVYNLALYMYFTSISIQTIQNYDFKSTVVVFVLLYLWLFIGRKHQKNKIKTYA